jgi:hypothetical protein
MAGGCSGAIGLGASAGGDASLRSATALEPDVAGGLGSAMGVAGAVEGSGASACCSLLGAADAPVAGPGCAPSVPVLGLGVSSNTWTVGTIGTAATGNNQFTHGAASSSAPWISNESKSASGQSRAALDLLLAADSGR